MNVLRILFACCVLCISGAAVADDAALYIGMVHPPLAAGCKALTSRSIYADQEGTVLGFTYAECGASQMLWFDKFDGRKHGIATWKILDAVTVPVLAHQSFLDIGCSGATRPDDYVVAVGTWVKRGQGGYLTDITAAWAVDPQKLKLITLSPHTVKCVVEQ